MKRSSIGYAMAACGLAIFLAGCGSDDSPAPVPPVEVPTGSSPIRLTASTSADTFAALAPKVKVGTVTIASPPVVHFSMTDADDNPIIGFGSTSKSASATVASYPNLAFSLAKLVPAANGSPSKWVNYIVTTVPTVSSPNAAPQRPGTDNTGTLVDNGNGTYSYTFYRDIPQIKAQIDAMTVSGVNNKADLGDLTYEPNLVHRLTIQVSGNAPGTGTNTANAVQTTAGVPMTHPLDVIYDFIPATGQVVTDSGREIVATAKCNECHSQLGGIPGDSPESSGAGFHGGSRNETKYCVVCHTDQRKYGRAEATLDASNTFIKPSSCTSTAADNPDPRCTYRLDGRAIGNLPNHIHKTHMGALLAKKKYDYADVLYNEVRFPQDIRNCTKCHDGSDTSTAKTAQGDNWKNAPNRMACGACHDGINFATGAGVTLADAAKGLTSTTSFPGGMAHGAGLPLADDSQCADCHKPALIDLYHLPVTPPNEGSALHVTGGNSNTNSAWIASNTNRLPAGAIKVSYDIKSVSVNASNQPVMVFRMLQNGARKDLNDFATTAVNPATGTKELWDNFMGAPSVYFVFAVPQDGIAAPADFNATVNSYLRSLWNGTATSGTGKGTLSGPDTDGYYTATLTGVTIPASAVMLTGGLGFSYSVTSTLPLTQTNLPAYPVSAPTATGQTNKIGGLIVIAPNVTKVGAGYTGRRPVVEDARCNNCHQELGTFTEDAFHAGQRNDGTTCAWCHRPNQTSSGWSADSTSFVHSIHGGAKRTVPFTWHASSTSESFANVKYPGVLKNCEACHLPGTYDFSATASANALPNRLYRTVGTGIFNGTAGTTTPTYSGSSCAAGTSTATAVSVFSLSPYVAKDNTTNYGAGFSFNPGLTAVNVCKPDGTVVSNPAGGTFAADATTLVNSPIATACVACHDNQSAPFNAIDHMQRQGASFYAPRSTALVTSEQCMLCHGPGAIVAIKEMHAK